MFIHITTLKIRTQEMAKRQVISARDILIPTILFTSILLNIYLVEWPPLSWSRKAAEEAESAAAISCSGHGRVYLDTLTLTSHGKSTPVCECHQCFVGSDCSQFQHSCPADANSGEPYFLEPFWMQNAELGTVLVSGWHRMGYAFSNTQIESKELENNIRKLHDFVGNAVTKGKYIVFGFGTTQLINAAINILSPKNLSSPTRVVASIPYYSFYKDQTEFFQTSSYKFEGDASLWKNNNSSDNIIELVTSPNNPDCVLNKAILKGPNVKTIHDRVYYWPHFTPISAPADEDIMLFSLSKLTGHAGTRFGWAVVKDEEVYKKMYTHVTMSTMVISKDTQLRALQLIKVALDDTDDQLANGKTLLEFGYQTMSKRWSRLSKVISVSKRFSLQKVQTQHCNFFKTVREASPGYAWIKCERDEDKDCYAVLEAANIIGRRGSYFGAEQRFVRLTLLKGDDDFDLLIHRLNELVSQEYNIEALSI